MSKTKKMTDRIWWKTDRKDLVERVRIMSLPAVRTALGKHVTARQVRGMTHEEAANRLMTLVLEGAIPETAIPKNETSEPT